MPTNGISNSLINGGTFTMVDGGYHVHPSGRDVKPALKLLHSHIAAGAFHNSAERYDPPKCHPNTREAIIKEIKDWVNTNASEIQPFLWMYGPAGTGKSSIAQTIAEMLYAEGKLAASFFFSRVVDARNTANHLIATLAYQLTLSIPRIGDHIFRTLAGDPAIFSKSLEAQLDGLIVQPLSRVSVNIAIETQSTNRLVPNLIIIDGLDECRESKSQRHILTVLFSAVTRFRLPLCFLIASRPEYEIRSFFNEERVNSLARSLVLDEKYDPDTDIAIFLRSGFNDIRQRHPSGSYLPPTWPSDSEIDQIVQKASGQFIYASTVMKFVESPNHWPTDRLDIIFGLTSPGKNTPFADLDALYALILVSADNTEAVIKVFNVLLFRESEFGEDIHTIEHFLCFRRGELQVILKDLHSVLYVPSAGKGSHVLHVYHASLWDFLLDRTRSGTFFIDATEGQAQMARYYLEYLSKHASSHRNVCAPTLISHLNLMRRCQASTLATKGLLEDLHKFDFGAYLDMQLLDTEQQDVRHLVPPFFDWLRNQADSNNETDLYHRYLAHFDRFLKVRLGQYPEDPCSSYLFTAATLPGFSEHSYAIFLVLTTGVQHPVYQSADFIDIDRRGCLFRSIDYKAMVRYHLMVAEFLTDGSRSGVTYHVTTHKYKNLAALFVLVLTTFPTSCIEPEWVRSNEMGWIENCCLDLLCSILAFIPVDRILAKYLHDNLIPKQSKFSTEESRKKTLFAIQSYIERSDIRPLRTPCNVTDSLSAQQKATTTSIALRENLALPSKRLKAAVENDVPGPERSQKAARDRRLSPSVSKGQPATTTQRTQLLIVPSSTQKIPSTVTLGKISAPRPISASARKPRVSNENNQVWKP